MRALLCRTCIIFLLLVLSCCSLAAQWKKMPSPELASLQVVFFVDDMLGFVGGMGAVAKTTDGGDTWKTMVLPKESNFITGIVFPTREVGYESEQWKPGIARTTDGGNQVMPNPLEATSRISYRVTNVAEVTLTLYTQLGETVATLVDEYQEPGNYTIAFSPADRILPAGMYYLRLSSFQSLNHPPELGAAARRASVLLTTDSSVEDHPYRHG